VIVAPSATDAWQKAVTAKAQTVRMAVARDMRMSGSNPVTAGLTGSKSCSTA
jgi:hypothetical protein